MNFDRNEAHVRSALGRVRSIRPEDLTVRGKIIQHSRINKLEKELAEIVNKRELGLATLPLETM